jgi:predicted glycogen debranching enzyme
MKLPTITLTAQDLAQFDEATTKEWLVPNGLGGYASSTVLGLNTRKYHGLLVAALHPPGDRTVCLSKIDEDIAVGGDVVRFGVNEFHDTFYPQGHKFLKELTLSPFPTYTYATESFVMKKTVGLAYGKNLTVVLYHFQNRGVANAKIHVYPLVTCRHFHTVINHQQNQVSFRQEHTSQDVTLSYVSPKATIAARATAGQFVEQPNWVETMHYREEDARGESDTDDSYQPGYYEIALEGGSEVQFGVAVSASEDAPDAANTLNLAGYTTQSVQQLIDWQLERYSHFLDRFYGVHEQQVPVSDWLNWILLASDAFVVQDIGEKRAVIAGYFWFEPWGRDTFVSLPGLMLVTNRFDDAKFVLLSFSHYCRKGLIPNIILDASGDPIYNTVDGTLWYINAVLQYAKYTGDLQFIQEKLWTMLKNIIEYHEAGTDFDIKVDTDGLLKHGARLTWMDACIQGVAVTPREGKAVEIQALWYNALRIMELFANKFGEKTLADKYAAMAEKVCNAFATKFWNRDRNCLFDVVADSTVDLSMRPNQIFAVSLDFTMLPQDQNRQVVEIVQKEFLTPRGLRTLSRSDPKYKKIYNGIMSSRDQAYHNGAVWPWLLGPFVNAYFKANGHTPQNNHFVSRMVLQPLFEEQIHEGGLGTVNEIFDGDAPHHPRGCIAQAWSVAEPLRAYVEELLQIRPKYERALLNP